MSLVLMTATCAMFALAPTVAAQLPGTGQAAVPAPVQPDTVSLPGSRDANREIWHLSNGRLAVRNVTHPTLTMFRPIGKVEKTAVIIAPGGAFLGLEIDKEGWDVARWFARHGVTAFVLKYRVLPTPADQKVFAQELDKMVHGKKAIFAPPDDTPQEALADGAAALRYVRSHANELGIDPQRVGFMGFSAGGFIARSLVGRGGIDRPDFVAPIYPNMSAMTVPADAPPMFVAVAADDFLLARQKGLPLVESYRAAGKPIEFHLFATGGHGFAAGPTGSPEEGWLDLMLRWMRFGGFVGK